MSEDDEKTGTVELTLESTELTATQQKYLAFLAPGGLLMVILLLVFFSVPTDSRDMLNIALGWLGAMAKDVYGYEFGSSRGSREKDKYMETK